LEPIRNLRTKQDDSGNITARVLNFARSNRRTALTQNFPATSGFDSRRDSFFGNEARRLREHPESGATAQRRRAYFFLASA
jgi:hypothetical protein